MDRAEMTGEVHDYRPKTDSWVITGAIHIHRGPKNRQEDYYIEATCIRGWGRLSCGTGDHRYRDLKGISAPSGPEQAYLDFLAAEQAAAAAEEARRIEEARIQREQQIAVAQAVRVQMKQTAIDEARTVTQEIIADLPGKVITEIYKNLKKLLNPDSDSRAYWDNVGTSLLAGGVATCTEFGQVNSTCFGLAGAFAGYVKGKGIGANVQGLQGDQLNDFILNAAKESSDDAAKLAIQDGTIYIDTPFGTIEGSPGDVVGIVSDGIDTITDILGLKSARSPIGYTSPEGLSRNQIQFLMDNAFSKIF